MTIPNNPRYIPVPNWNEYHNWPRIGGLRNLIFKRKTNGFDRFGVIKKVGKRVLIDETAFFEWVESQQGVN
jgi:hypothetical protein